MKTPGPFSFSVRFPECFPRMCGRIKQLISPRKIRGATTTPSSSRTTTSSCFQWGKWEGPPPSSTTRLKRTTWRFTWRQSTERQSVSNATKTESSYCIGWSWEKIIDPARHDVPRTPWKSDEWKENNRRKQHWTETTIEMSLRLLGGMEKSELMDTLESEEDRGKKAVGWSELGQTHETKWRRVALKKRNNRHTQKIRWKTTKIWKSF